MRSFLNRLRSREPRAELVRDDDRLLVALVNEARSDAQISRAVRQARRRAARRR